MLYIIGKRQDLRRSLRNSRGPKDAALWNTRDQGRAVDVIELIEISSLTSVS